MSIQYCPECNKNIDTDLEAEHFDEHERELAEEAGLAYAGNDKGYNEYIGNAKQWDKFAILSASKKLNK